MTEETLSATVLIELPSKHLRNLCDALNEDNEWDQLSLLLSVPYDPSMRLVIPLLRQAWRDGKSKEDRGDPAMNILLNICDHTRFTKLTPKEFFMKMMKSRSLRVQRVAEDWMHAFDNRPFATQNYETIELAARSVIAAATCLFEQSFLLMQQAHTLKKINQIEPAITLASIAKPLLAMANEDITRIKEKFSDPQATFGTDWTKLVDAITKMAPMCDEQ